MEGSNKPGTPVNPTVMKAGSDSADAKKNKAVSILAYLWILFFLPLVVCPDSKFGRFHANQGLILFLFSTVGNIILRLIPLVGGVLGWIYTVLMVLLMLIGMVHAYQGKTEALPLIGNLELLH